MSLSPAPFRKFEGGRLEAFGTSRTAGALSSSFGTGPYDSADMYPSKLASMLGLSHVNNAMSGSIMAFDENGVDGGGWAAIMHRTVRLKPLEQQQPGSPNPPGNFNQPNAVVVMADWINDQAIVNTGAAGATRVNSRTQAIAQNCMRTLISLFCSARRWEPSHTAPGELSFAGTASTHVPVAYDVTRSRPWRGAVSGPGGYRSMVNGSTVTIPLPADYPGSASCPVAVLFSGQANVATGQAVSSGTGVPAKTLDLAGGNFADPSRTNPLIMRFSGSDLSAGAKNIVITTQNLTGGSANARFQGAWIESDTPPIVLMYATIKSNPIGFFYPQSIESDFTTWNGWLQSVIGEFGSHVRYVTVPTLEGGTSPNNDLLKYYTDTMHHSDIGEAEKALYGYAKVTGEGITTALRQRARRAKSVPGDIVFTGGISADVSVANNANTTLTINVEIEDNTQMHDDTNPTRIYCMSPGRYVCHHVCSWQATDTGGYRRSSIRVTRATPHHGSTGEWVAVGTATAAGTNVFFPPITGGSGEVEMRKGDYLEWVCEVVGASGAQNVLGGQTLGVPARIKVRKVADV